MADREYGETEVARQSADRRKRAAALILAALSLAALPARAEVFHEPLCENLPEVSPELKAWVARVAPELARVRVRELPDEAAIDVFGRAAAVGWGSIDVLTHDVFREPCTFYLSGEALRAVDAAFDVSFLTPIKGHDTRGQDFEMTAILAGRGKLVVFYGRGGIVYRNEKQNRDFELAPRVEFDAPAAGVLEGIHGLCAKVLLLGCVRVRSMVKGGETVEVRTGTFTTKSPLKPIQARRPGQVPPGVNASDPGAAVDPAGKPTLGGHAVREDELAYGASPGGRTSATPASSSPRRSRASSRARRCCCTAAARSRPSWRRRSPAAHSQATALRGGA